MAHPTVLSFSSIGLWRNCPMSWKAKYIDKLTRAPSSDARLGNMFDQYVTNSIGCVNVDRDGTVTPQPELTPPLKRLVDAYKVFPGSWMETKPAQKPKAQVHIMLSPEQWGVMAEKYGANTHIAYPVQGYADITRFMPDGIRMELLDLKTSSRHEFQPSWNYQILFYAAALDCAKASIHLVSSTKTKVTCDERSFLLAGQKPLVKAALDYIAGYSNTIKRELDVNELDDLPRNGGHWCRWCPIEHECPVPLAVK